MSDQIEFPTTDARKLILDDLEAVQRVMLTSQQWDVLRFIKKRVYIQSSDITSRFKFSPQHTAMITAALFRKGYLSRDRESSPSGGPEYAFRLKQELLVHD